MVRMEIQMRIKDLGFVSQRLRLMFICVHICKYMCVWVHINAYLCV